MKLILTFFNVFVLSTLTVTARQIKSTTDSKAKKRNSAPLIIGGALVSIKDYPFVVGLVQTDRRITDSLCGGTIITEYFVLTAAHCLANFTTKIHLGLIFVRGGATNIRGASGYDHRIYGYVIHEKFSWDTGFYDIALIQVKDPLNNMFEKSIGYALTNYTYPLEKAAVFGWGAVDLYTSSEKLKCTEVYVRKTCGCKLPDYPWWFCAGKSGADAFTGDSGGPLIQNNITIGIVSFGDCSVVYTKVGYFEQWISKTMANVPSIEDLIIG